MGSFEENSLYRDRLFRNLARAKSLHRMKSKRPEPVLEPMGMYDTAPGNDLIESTDFFDAFGDLEGEVFQTYLKSMRLFGEGIRLAVENCRSQTS